MVSKRRLGCSLIGYQPPFIPKAPRSIRKRGPRKKHPEDGNLCPIELLAAVAGKLWEESESSTLSNTAEVKVKPCIDRVNEDTRPNSDSKGLISESFDHGSSSAESSFVPETSPEKRNNTYATTGNLEKAVCGTKLGICDIKYGKSSVCVVNCSDYNIETEGRVCSDKNQIGDLSLSMAGVKDLKQECVNSSNTILNNAESGVQFPLHRDHSKNVQLGIRDDDEKNRYGGNNKLGTNIRPFRSEPKFMRQKINKLLRSSLMVAAPKMRDLDHYNSSQGMKSFYRYRKKLSYTRERFHYHHSSIKKRKWSYFKSAYDQDMSCGSVSSSPDKGVYSNMKIHKKATNPKMKLKIKSFMVPELCINLAGTDTIGDLKSAVMEEITALFGGGIRVGVVFKGRKCRGNNRTLQQAGISECSYLDGLDFTLEPKLARVSPPSEAADNPYTTRFPVIDSGISTASVDPPHSKDIDDVNNNNKYNHLVPSPQTPPNNETPANKEVSSSDSVSKALVPVIPINHEALAIIPVNQKPIKRSELSQRRTRRPFSVAEVEALVSAVEKLGTGRWRDVKMGVFENVDHRTYVDLKDKWKTLVHTASISPHQRRGEPVPQDLLNRVLDAHSYWSQHQSKQHGKNSNNSEPMEIGNNVL